MRIENTEITRSGQAGESEIMYILGYTGLYWVILGQWKIKWKLLFWVIRFSNVLVHVHIYTNINIDKYIDN